MPKKEVLKMVFKYRLFPILGFFVLLGFSVYNYSNNEYLKRENSELSKLLNKTVILLTPTPTLMPSSTIAPSPTPGPVLSEYVYIPLPHNGAVYSCKRSGEILIREASLALAKVITDNQNCQNNSDNKDSECTETNNERQISCIKQRYTKCSDYANRQTEANNNLQSIIKDNCVDVSDSANDSNQLHAAP